MSFLDKQLSVTDFEFSDSVSSRLRRLFRINSGYFFFKFLKKLISRSMDSYIDFAENGWKPLAILNSIFLFIALPSTEFLLVLYWLFHGDWEDWYPGLLFVDTLIMSFILYPFLLILIFASRRSPDYSSYTNFDHHIYKITCADFISTLL